MLWTLFVSQGYQHLGRFAEAEIAAPTQHIPSQLLHCGLDADALDPSCDVPDSLLEPFQGRATRMRTAKACGPAAPAGGAELADR